jgi:glycosyltransferase
MKVSVVTVSRNSAATIGLTIRSFLKQRHPDKELLVVDSCSTDGTVAIVQSFDADNIKLISEADSGIYDAMNKGLRLFTGEAIGFLNSDDTFRSEDSLSLIAEGLAEADIVYGDLYIVTDHHTKRVFRTWKAGGFSASSLGSGWMPPHPTFYIRRKVAETIGEFDLRYQVASDYDYMLRAMFLHRHKINYVPRFLVDYQLGGISSGSLRGIVTGNLECLDSRRRHLKTPAVDRAFFLRPVRRLLQVRWSSLLAPLLGPNSSNSRISSRVEHAGESEAINSRAQQHDLGSALQLRKRTLSSRTGKDPTSGASPP